MKRGEEVPRITLAIGKASTAAAELARGRRVWTPKAPAFRAVWRRVPWRLALLCLGIVVQAGLVWLLWQVVDLCIQLFEAWAMLARYSLGL
jgi:hypothetical protein